MMEQRSLLIVVVTLILSLNSSLYAQEELRKLPAFSEMNHPFSNVELHDIDYQVIYSGSDSRDELYASLTVINSERHFKTIWSKINHSPKEKEKVPEIDFKRYCVIMFKPTYLSTGCARTEITRVTRLGDSCYLLVDCTRTLPSPDQMVTCDVVFPVHLIRVPFNCLAAYREISKTAK